MKYIIAELTKKLRTEFKIEELQHGYRFNDVADIFKKKLTVYDINKNKYHRLETIEEAERVLRQIVSENPVRIFKKTEAGNMSYKEFKHNLKNL